MKREKLELGVIKELLSTVFASDSAVRIGLLESNISRILLPCEVLCLWEMLVLVLLLLFIELFEGGANCSCFANSEENF